MIEEDIAEVIDVTSEARSSTTLLFVLGSLRSLALGVHKWSYHKDTPRALRRGPHGEESPTST